MMKDMEVDQLALVGAVGITLAVIPVSAGRQSPTPVVEDEYEPTEDVWDLDSSRSDRFTMLR